MQHREGGELAIARVSIKFTGEPTDANRASESVERGLEGVSKQAIQTRASLAGVFGGTTQAKEFAAAIDGIDVRMGGLGKRTRDVNQGFTLLGNVMGLLKWPAFIAAAGFAAQALSVLAGGAVALAGALGPLTGLLAAVPVALGAMAASVVTVKLAFADMKEAMAGNAEAIKRLTPEARAFAETLKGLTPIIKELRQAAQQGLFPGLEQALKTVLTRENLAAVKAGLTGVGQALGDAAVSIAKVLGQKQFAADLNVLFKQFESIIRSAGVAGGFFAVALVNIMVSARPLIDFLNQSIVAFARWTAESTSAGRATGDLQKFFEGTVATMKQLGAILGPLGSALINIFKAAKPLTDAILKDLAAVTKEFAAWTASASGQNALAKYFTDVKEPLYEMARLIRDVVKAFFELGTQPGLTNLVRQIRVELLPAIVTLISTTTQTLGPALIDLFTNAARLMTQLAGATGPLISLVKILGGMAGALADFLEQHDELRNMVTSFASMVAISKAISFAAAITGARALAASLGLIAPSAGRAAAGVAVSNAAMTASLGGTRLAATRVGLAFGPWGIAIATAVAIIYPYLDELKKKLDDVLPDWLATGAGSPGRQEFLETIGVKSVSPGSSTVTVKPSPGAAKHPDSAGGGRGPGGVASSAPTPYERLGSASDIVAVGSILQGMGLSVGEHPAFGGVDPVHTDGSYHYSGQAIDVTGPVSTLDLAAAALSKNPNVIELIWRSKGHYNHMHVAMGAVSSSGTYYNVGGDMGTQLGLGTGALTATGAAAVTPISPAQVALGKVIGGLKEQAAALTDDIPEIAKALGPKLEALYDKLGDKALSATALASIKATGVELRHALSNMIKGDELRDKIPNLRATIGMIADDETRADLKKRTDALAALTSKFWKDNWLSDKELAILEAQTKKLNEIVSKAFGKDLQEQVKVLRGQLNDLFAKGFIDEASLDKAREALDRIPAMYARFMKDGVLGPKERQALAKQLDIAEEIVKAGQDAEKAAEKAMGRVKATFRNLFADGVVSDADLALLSKAVAGIGGKIGEGMQAAVAAVEKGRADFDSAWAGFRSAIERAFSEQVIGKFQLTIDFASIYEQGALGERALEDATTKWNAVISGSMDAGAQAVRAAVERVLAANAEYTAAIISQDRDRIKAAIDERIRANAELAALAASGLSDEAKAVLAAGQDLIAAHKEIGAQQIAEQKRIWEETKTAALAGVLAVVDEVGQKLRDGKITWAEAVGEIGRALTAAGMDAGAAADLLGSNISSAMGLAARAIELAVGALTEAINRLVVLMGGAVTTAKGHVQTAEELYNKIMALGGATDAEARRIANAAQQAGITAGAAAPLPAPAAGSTFGPAPGVQYPTGMITGGGAPALPPPSNLTYTYDPNAPYASPTGYAGPPQGGPASLDLLPGDPVYSTVPGSPGYKKPILEYAIGGVARWPQIARIAEKYQEAIVPMPPHMHPDLRAWLTELAEGGWRRQIPIGRRPGGGWGSLPTPGQPTPPRMVVPRAGLLALGTGGLGQTPGMVPTGGTTVQVTVPVRVDAGVLTSEAEVGETIARVAGPGIRDWLIRLGVNNGNIFGGRG